MSATPTPELVYVPLYVAEWIGKYSHLSLAEQGALLRLVIHQWRFESVPGADAEAVARILGVGRREAAKLMAVLEPFFNMRTLENGWQIGHFSTLRAKSAKTAATNAARATAAAQKRWTKPQKTDAPALPQSNAPSSPPSNAESKAFDAPSNASHISNTEVRTNNQILDLEESQGEAPPPPPMPRPVEKFERVGGPLIGRGEGVVYAKQMNARHAGCHSVLCTWKSPSSPLRRCVPAALAEELANNYADGTERERLERLLAWAPTYRPPAGSVATTSDFEFWRKAFNETQATASAVAPMATPSGVPSEAETIARYGA